ncbi:hypothetical protein F66182_1177 [Fusarium sp. NRRL 66182]|nr:hypothetical protein F66182_1177 [Fusarium sp. NRRL 66182]
MPYHPSPTGAKRKSGPIRAALLWLKRLRAALPALPAHPSAAASLLNAFHKGPRPMAVSAEAFVESSPSSVNLVVVPEQGSIFLLVVTRPSPPPPPPPPPSSSVHGHLVNIPPLLLAAMNHSTFEYSPAKPSFVASTTTAHPSDDPAIEMSSSKDKDGFGHGFMPGRIFADITCTLLPLALLGLAGAVMLLDDKVVDDEVYKKWENAITVTLTDQFSQTASIFPILFASTVGRMVYEVARWKLEKGATLHLLEQLIGSRTVGSTLITHISLRRFNILGLVMLLLWALSPLGSQSVLRMLRTRLVPTFQPSQLSYYSTDAQSHLQRTQLKDPATSATRSALINFIQTMYSALLLSPLSTKTNAMDLWGNVKIPRLDTNASGDAWRNVSWSAQPESFSALVGLPVANVVQGNATFSLESSYIDLNCSKIARDYSYSSSIKPNFTWTDPDSPFPEPLPNGTWHGLNKTDTEMPWAVALDRFVDEFWYNDRNLTTWLGVDNATITHDLMGRPMLFENETGLDVKPARLLFFAHFRYTIPHYTPDMRIITDCHAVQRYVESRVTCSRVDEHTPQNCSVVAQRPSRKPHAPEGITMLSFPTIWNQVTETFPAMMGQGATFGQVFADTAMRYLDDPRLANITTEVDDEYILSKVDQGQFSRRFSQILNTYMLLSQLYRYAPQGSADADAIFEPRVTTPVRVSNLVQVYAVDWLWIAFFFASSAVLFVSGLTSVVFAHLALGPEILGYASSLVRDSRYIQLPPEAGRKEATDVTLMMGQQRIRYGFTDAVSEEGRPLVGVGLEEQIQGIKRTRSSKSDSG